MLDLAIVNGTLIDPEAGTSQPENLGILSGHIVARGAELPPARASIDASGALVCPGFVDVHGHLDGDPYPGLLSLHQGVTTTVGGNCGYSPARLAEFFTQQELTGYPLHQAELVGHSFTLRHLAGIDNPHAAATPAQIDRMVALARHAFAAGACGLSFGLGYAPGSSHAETLALCRVAAEHERIVAVDTNMRSNDDLESITEVLQLARESGAHMHLSHFVYQYGEAVPTEALTMLANARHEGLHITADSGLYSHWATGIGATLFEPESMRRNSIRPENIRMASGPHRGMQLTDELLAHVRACHSDESAIVYVDNEEAIYTILRAPDMMPSSDAGGYAPGEGHPQIAGTFPRFFRKMVIERGEFSWVEAVRRATLLPARTFGLIGRGRVSIGAVADIAIIDPDTLRDHAGFPDCEQPQSQPDALPEGVRHVVVGGVHALADGQVLCDTAGKVIRFR